MTAHDNGPGADRAVIEKSGRAGADATSMPRQAGTNAPDARTGRQRMVAGVGHATENRDPWWWDGALRAVETMAATGRPFQMYDVAETFGLPEPDNFRRWGALACAARRLGLIEPVGYAPSRRPSAACSAARVWRGRAAS